MTTTPDGQGVQPEPAESTDRAPSVLRLMDSVVGRHRAAMTGISVSAVAGAFCEALVLLLIARLALTIAQSDTEVDIGLGPLGSVTLSVPALVAIGAALAIARLVFQLLQAWLTARTYAVAWSGIRERLLDRYVEASWAVQASERGGRLQELATTFATFAARTVVYMSEGLVALLSLVAFFATALIVNVFAALAVVVAALVVAAILLPLRRSVRKWWRLSGDANMAVATDITEFAANMQEVRVFGIENSMRADITARIQNTGRLAQKAQYIIDVAPALYQGIALLLIVCGVGIVYAAGVSQLSSLGGIVLVMLRSVAYGQKVQSSYQSLQGATPYLEGLQAELDRYEAAKVHRDGVDVDRIGSISFTDVSYEYEPGQPVLQDVSFDLVLGETVGIVGPSGSGKSTLVQIMLRLREPTRGWVGVDGVNAGTISLDSWYQRVSFVPQESRFFAGTVAENIRFFRSAVDDEAVANAAKLANLEGDIESWPMGYDTPVGEGGGQLSGGQRQRLSLARALARDPDILVLDEPTSALDVRSEALIRETLRKVADHTTVVIIAHRLSTLDICDRIMVVKDGLIQGLDAPERLERTNPFYRESLRLSGLR